MRLIVLSSILLCLIGGFAAAADKAATKDAEKVLSKSAAETVVTDYLKENTNDPSKLQIVKVGDPLPLSTAYWWDSDARRENYSADIKAMGLIENGYWQPIGSKGTAIPVKFRATNALGALVLTEKVFCINEKKEVVKTVAVQDFSPTKPQQKADPITEQFDEMARQAAKQLGK